VLIVEDDSADREALSHGLRAHGHHVETASTGTEALRQLSGAPSDAILLDVLLPDVDGLEVCRRARRSGVETPVLMLTARGEVADRVAGLAAGADDYLVKPVAFEELLARLRAVSRRVLGTGAELVLGFHDLTMEVGSRDVRRGARLIELTQTEFSLLELFLRHPRQVLTRSQIFEQVWGHDFGPGSTSLAVYVGYLRRKTEAMGEPRLIQTVRGVGYALRSS